MSRRFRYKLELALEKFLISDEAPEESLEKIQYTT